MSTRVIQVRPSRSPRWQKQGGWEAFEAEGVCPVYCGTNGRDTDRKIVTMKMQPEPAYIGEDGKLHDFGLHDALLDNEEACAAERIAYARALRQEKWN